MAPSKKRKSTSGSQATSQKKKRVHSSKNRTECVTRPDDAARAPEDDLLAEDGDSTGLKAAENDDDDKVMISTKDSAYPMPEGYQYQYPEPTTWEGSYTYNYANALSVLGEPSKAVSESSVGNDKNAADDEESAEASVQPTQEDIGLAEDANYDQNVCSFSYDETSATSVQVYDHGSIFMLSQMGSLDWLDSQLR